MSNYPGDSAGKKAARSWAYDQVTDLTSKYHVIIPSQFGGDIDELVKRKVNPDHIFASDLDRLAAVRASARGCRAYYTSIQSLIQYLVTTDYEIGSVNVDLCNTIQLAVSVLNSVLVNLHVARWSGVVMFTFARGYKDGLADGTQGDSKRIHYLNEFVHRANSKKVIFTKESLYNYQSKTNDSCGSPMSLVVMRADRGKLSCVTAT